MTILTANAARIGVVDHDLRQRALTDADSAIADVG